MAWKKYNGRIIAVCTVILMLGMTGFFAGRGAECEGTQEEQQSDTAAEQEQQTPAPVVVEPDSTEAGQAGSGAADASEAGTSGGAAHDFAPVSYDLSEIPAMENRMYAAWEGNIYYRQYGEEDYDGIHDRPVPDAGKELMCMKPDGRVVQVGTDYGYGAMYIADGRIYSQKEVDHGRIVYSCALDGSDVKEYDSHGDYCELLCIRGSKLICEYVFYGISVIDRLTGQERIIAQAQDEASAEFLGATEEQIFFSKDIRDEEAVGIYAADYEGNVRCLHTFTRQAWLDYMESRVGEYITYIGVSRPGVASFQILGDDLYLSVGTSNGTGLSYSGGMLVRMKKDGSDCEILTDSADEYFYLYDDGKNQVLYSGGAALLLKGEMPENLTPRAQHPDSWGWEYGGAYSQPQMWRGKDEKESMLVYPDTSGVCYVLLIPQECESLGIRTFGEGRDRLQQIRDMEYLEGRLFFTVTDTAYSEEFSTTKFGAAYERGRSVCYCKDMESGEIRVLYEY